MKKEKWLCLDCGARFNDPNPGGIEIDRTDGTVIAEFPKNCPCCHSTEITYGYWECEYCGEAYEHYHEMETEKVCKVCYSAAKTEILTHLENGKPLSEETKEIIREVLQCTD